MLPCLCRPVEWKQRRGYQLSNGIVELTLLTGGGHIADFRLCGASTNLIWEAPWQTIEPQSFSDDDIPRFGDRAIGRFLSGYTGHALVLGYFGMPSPDEVTHGLPLHGEAASAEWTVSSTHVDEQGATLIAEVELPAYLLRCRREVTLRSNTSIAAVQETVTSLADRPLDFHWVQHAAFGPPLLTHDSQLFLPAAHAITWPLGYEGISYLRSDAEFHWPNAPKASGGAVDLSHPFEREGTGFVASVLIDPARKDAYAAVLNRQLGLVAGYHFDRGRFPWVALWEENRARDYAPWNGITQVRGVEFGNTPMPLGLEHARRTQQMFGTPTLTTLPPREQLQTNYKLFVGKFPEQCHTIFDVVLTGSDLLIRCDRGVELRIPGA